MKIIEQTKQNCLQLYLPNEIVNIILEYNGYHIWRNGKFICRLNINDKKYNNLKKLNIIKKSKDSYKVTITIMRNHYLYKYTIEQKIYSNMIHWYMDRYWYHSIHINKKRYNKPYIDETRYVFGKHISQNLPMLRMDFTYKK
jgi:hypothetical protein